MKNIPKVLLAVASATAVFPTMAEPGLSYNIGVVTLYKSNGVDQDSRQADKVKNVRPALQGGVDYDFGNGFYVGNWNSTGTFGNANLEIDLYGGYRGEFGGGWGYDVGYAHYIYPNDKQFGNGGELYGSVSYGIATFKVTYGVSDNYESESGKAKSRYSLTLAQPVSDSLTLKLVLADRNKAAGGFSDFGVGADYDLGDGLTLSALVSGAGKVDGAKPDAHKTRLVLGLSKSF